VSFWRALENSIRKMSEEKFVENLASEPPGDFPMLVAGALR